MTSLTTWLTNQRHFVKAVDTKNTNQPQQSGSHPAPLPPFVGAAPAPPAPFRCSCTSPARKSR